MVYPWVYPWVCPLGQATASAGSLAKDALVGWGGLARCTVLPIPQGGLQTGLSCVGRLPAHRPLVRRPLCGERSGSGFRQAVGGRRRDREQA